MNPEDVRARRRVLLLLLPTPLSHESGIPRTGRDDPDKGKDLEIEKRIRPETTAEIVRRKLVEGADVNFRTSASAPFFTTGGTWTGATHSNDNSARVQV